MVKDSYSLLFICFPFSNFLSLNNLHWFLQLTHILNSHFTPTAWTSAAKAENYFETCVKSLRCGIGSFLKMLFACFPSHFSRWSVNKCLIFSNCGIIRYLEYCLRFVRLRTLKWFFKLPSFWDETYSWKNYRYSFMKVAKWMR